MGTELESIPVIVLNGDWFFFFSTSALNRDYSSVQIHITSRQGCCVFRNASLHRFCHVRTPQMLLQKPREHVYV